MNKFKTIIFYILSFTWGLLYTLIGSLVMLVLLIAGKKPERFNDRFYIRVGKKSWGGCEMGPWFICDQSPTLHIKQHESGHGFQNVLWGPLFPFVVCIPSAIRYWLYEIKPHKYRKLFCGIITGLIGWIGCSFLIPGIIFSAIWAICIGAFILAFMVYIIVLIDIIELPKFRFDENQPKYDDMWFEGQASKWGAKMYPTDNKD